VTIEVPLTRGYVALIDDEDADLVLSLKWSTTIAPATQYALTNLPVARVERSRRRVLMHRLILGLEGPLPIDHINRNGLDNRRGNLRPATTSQNIANRRNVPNSTGYRGVYQDNRDGRFQGQVRYNFKLHSAGTFKTAIEAAKARDALALRLHGEFATLNFPQSDVGASPLFDLENQKHPSGLISPFGDINS
jgi:hypothetical protein